MLTTDSQIIVHEQLRNELEAIEGVQRAVVEAARGEIVVVCDGESRSELESAVGQVLEREGVDAAMAELFFTHPARPTAQRRVRFKGVEVEHPQPSFSVARVTLEWMDEDHTARAEGEGGGALELRVCAQGTIEALHGVLGGEVTFQLVGVKAIRIFDHDLIAVLLHSPQAPDRRLIGLSLVADDLERSACIAVLNATNRLLGNYLVAE